MIDVTPDNNITPANNEINKTHPMHYSILSENNTSTVVAHYERSAMVADDGYQTEADLERSLIEQLQRQGYEYAQIHNEDELTLKCDNGEEKNIYLIKKDDVHANRTQVINQYEVWEGKRPNRYDVSILVNGLPLVHIELKKRGVSIKEAFNQINRYGRESFWAGNGLFEYVQIFVVSNGASEER